jgi:hypothetical protein
MLRLFSSTIRLERSAKTLKMKKTILFFAVLLASATTTMAQNAKQDANGNYVAIQHDTTTTGTATGRTFTDAKGVVYPVLQSAKGKLYYMRTSKAGNIYKCYIKTESK